MSVCLHLFVCYHDNYETLMTYQPAVGAFCIGSIRYFIYIFACLFNIKGRNLILWILSRLSEFLVEAEVSVFVMVRV